MMLAAVEAEVRNDDLAFKLRNEEHREDERVEVAEHGAIEMPGRSVGSLALSVVAVAGRAHALSETGDDRRAVR
jgi:hypothetical protein